MDGALTAHHVLIRGHGNGVVQVRDDARVTIDCPSRLLPGRPYVVQGLDGVGDTCRMRVAASWVRTICGEAGVVYRVTLQADSHPDEATTRVVTTPHIGVRRG